MLMPGVYNAIIVFLILGMTYALASEGIWGSAVMFFDILFAGLITFNFYESLAGAIAENASSMAGWADFLSLFLIFFISLLALRITTDMIAPATVRLPTAVYHLGRIFFGLAASTTLMAILICMFQTAPVKKMIFGNLDYDFQPPFKLGIDRKWLAFVQYTSGYTFPKWDEDGPVDPEFQQNRVFDRHGSWLIDHQNARIGSEGFVPYPDSAAAEPAAPAAPPGGGSGRNAEAPPR